MASLQKHPSGVYRIRFRYGGMHFFRSLGTEDEETAAARKKDVEETIALLKQGRLSLPDDITADDAATFILSGGRVNGQVKIQKGQALEEVAKEYFRDMAAGKDPSTVAGERIHVKHLQRILGPQTPLRDIDVNRLRRYANERLKGRKGHPAVGSATVKKELGTLSQIWNYAREQGYVSEALPRRIVERGLPKPPQPARFQTMAEIERAIAGGDKSASWENLFLEEEDIRGLLEYVKATARHPFIYPMFTFAARTGARRSEIIRSRLSDIDLKAKQVWIRERKRVKDASESRREFPMCNQLAKVMEAWLAEHPGGSYTLCLPDNLERSRRKTSEPRPLTKDTATDHFKRTLAGSDKWSKIRGFHVLRHSVASLLASKGIGQSVINGLLGHTTDEMARRYRHLYPKERTAAISAAFDFNKLVENGS